MKNNAICFFVDSVTWNSLGTRQACVSPTPFLDSLVDESITASKLYSHGPYTDAATRSLFTGRDCLDDFGYYFMRVIIPELVYTMVITIFLYLLLLKINQKLENYEKRRAIKFDL